MTTSHHYRTVPPWVQKRREQARFEKQVMRRFDALAAEYRAINLALSAGKTMDDIEAFLERSKHAGGAQ